MLVSPLLSREQALLFVSPQQATLSLKPIYVVLADPMSLGRTAAAIAEEIFGTVEELDRLRIQTAEVAGCLLYSLDRYGLAYEDVCQLAGRPIAEILSRLSVDNRLPAPRRRTSQIARLSEQGDPDIIQLTQIVKIAEITQVTAALYNRFVRQGNTAPLNTATKNRINDWINDVRLMFVGFNRLERFKSRIATLCRALSAIQQKLATSSRSRQAALAIAN